MSYTHVSEIILASRNWEHGTDTSSATATDMDQTADTVLITFNAPIPCTITGIHFYIRDTIAGATAAVNVGVTKRGGSLVEKFTRVIGGRGAGRIIRIPMRMKLNSQELLSVRVDVAATAATGDGTGIMITGFFGTVDRGGDDVTHLAAYEE